MIPYTQPGQIEVSMPQENQNVNFKTLRKVETGESGGGTKIEIWFSFEKTGSYLLPPLVVKIKNSRKQISFSPITIGINPKEQIPVCSIVTDYGINKNISIAAGETVKFKLCLQYAVQLVQFNWDIPKDSIFAQTKTYEFTEIKQREKKVSDELIPVSDFEWTPLVSGNMEFPKFNIQAIAYNGDKVTVRVPPIKVNVLKSRNKKTQNDDSYFSAAFEADVEQGSENQKTLVTAVDASLLASLRSKERHSIFGKSRKQRVEYEKAAGLPYAQKEFKVFWVYFCFVVTVAVAVFLIIFLRKKKTRLSLLFGTVLLLMLIVSIYCVVCSKRKFGISTGGQICSIPEKSASIKSALPAGNRIQILDESGEWYLLRFGETEGWCVKETVELIK